METEDTVAEGVEVAEGAAAEGVVVEDEADQICVCFNSIDFFF
jgi:methylmalonyl-CoA mutase N-terminal domain/subunit